MLRCVFIIVAIVAVTLQHSVDARFRGPMGRASDYECVDKVPNCQDFLSSCENKRYIKEICQKTCGLCEKDSVPNARHEIEDLTDKVNKDLMSFEEFLLKYDKQYPDEAQYLKRKAIFEEAVRRIKENNLKWYSGKSTYKLGIKRFSDMELSEMPMGLDLSLARGRDQLPAKN